MVLERAACVRRCEEERMGAPAVRFGIGEELELEFQQEESLQLPPGGLLQDPQTRQGRGGSTHLLRREPRSHGDAAELGVLQDDGGGVRIRLQRLGSQASYARVPQRSWLLHR
ncbi:unnamed protein product [Staurois parvus]|uniref:Uncharacterized protein n=1 Tax=Staurois parvus TaxID=386267 RepID=A0ABN9EI76_9NEOB|nr:unnamed protein product [Staurois parvus]